METREDLKKLEEELSRIKTSYQKISTLWMLSSVIFIIFIIYFISFIIKIEIHEAIIDENISGMVEMGFDRVMSNYEIVE